MMAPTQYVLELPASIPEIEKLKNLHPTTGFVLRTEDGQEVGGPKERSSYDDCVVLSLVNP